MAPPMYRQDAYGVVGVKRRERTRWISQGVAALAISALGLAAAGSLTLTSDAQPTDVTRPRTTATLAPALPGSAPDPSATPVDPTEDDPALAAFRRQDDRDGTAPSRSADVRSAITKEQAAQRSEELAKTAEDVTRVARQASSVARQQDLTAAERAQQVASAKLAAENLRKATAARLAAAEQRRQAEQQQAEQQQSGQQQSGQQQDTEEPAIQAPDAPADPVRSSGGSASPVPGAIIGSHFGAYGSWSRYHTGLDFRAAYGTPIRAVKSGVVLYAGNTGNWAGNHVAIKHADGKTTMSSHMSSMSVRSGQSVKAGQLIGYVGQTGRAFGAHLHFELYPAGVRYGDVYKAVNPQPWLRANGVRTR